MIVSREEFEPARRPEAILAPAHFGSLILYSLLMIILTFVAMFLLGVIFALISRFSPDLAEITFNCLRELQKLAKTPQGELPVLPPLLINVILTLANIFYLVALAVIVLVAKISRPASLTLRLGWQGWQSDAQFWTLLGATLVYGISVSIIVKWLFPNLQSGLPGGHDTYGWTMILIALASLAPIAEELFFRGWIYTGLRTRLGFMPSVLITSVLFALAHVEKNLIHAVAIFPVGFVLGYIRERYHSSRASALFHILYNFCLLVVFYVLV